MKMYGLKNPFEEEKPDVPKNGHGWFGEKDTKVIREILEGRPTGTLLEIGSWLGKSTRWFCTIFDHVTCVDTWMGSRKFYKEGYVLKNVRAVLPVLFETFLVNCWNQKDQIFPVRMASPVGIGYLAEQDIVFNAVFLDGSHEYADVVEDLIAIKKLPGKPFVFGHDWFKKDEGDGILYPVQTALKKVFGGSIEHKDNIWWIK